MDYHSYSVYSFQVRRSPQKWTAFDVGAIEILWTAAVSPAAATAPKWSGQSGCEFESAQPHATRFVAVGWSECCKAKSTQPWIPRTVTPSASTCSCSCPAATSTAAAASATPGATERVRYRSREAVFANESKVGILPQSTGCQLVRGTQLWVVSVRVRMGNAFVECNCCSRNYLFLQISGGAPRCTDAGTSNVPARATRTVQSAILSYAGLLWIVGIAQVKNVSIGFLVAPERP